MKYNSLSFRILFIFLFLSSGIGGIFAHPYTFPLGHKLFLGLGLPLLFVAFLTFPTRVAYLGNSIWILAVYGSRLRWLLATPYQDNSKIAIFVVALLLHFLCFLGAFWLFDKKKAMPACNLLVAFYWMASEFFREQMLFYAFFPLSFECSYDTNILAAAGIVGSIGVGGICMARASAFARCAYFPTLKNLILSIAWTFLLPLLGAIHFTQSQPSSSSMHVNFLQPATKVEERIVWPGNKEAFIAPLQHWKDMLATFAKRKSKKLDLLVFPEAISYFDLESKVYAVKDIEPIFKANFHGNVLSTKPFSENEQYLSNKDILQWLANYLNTAVVAGVEVVKEEEQFNASVFFLPFQNAYQWRGKRILLPFIEHAPWKWMQHLPRKWGVKAFFTPGEVSPLYRWNEKKIGALICYETFFSKEAMELAKKGADFLVAHVNDAWYRNTLLEDLHLLHTRVRAVETGLPFLYASNATHSCVVEPNGMVHWYPGPRPLFQRDVVAVDWKPSKYRSLFLQIGPQGVLIFTSLMLLVIYGANRVRAKNLLVKNINP